ncbi:MAG: DUF952 domain-containing protein [Cyclobacteriaceae bacterium]
MDQLQPPLNPSEEIQAFCYLQRADDEANKCWLTNQRVIVKKRNKIHGFELGHLREITFGQRKAMLFLLFGGIALPLALVAFGSNLLNPWAAIVIIFSGIFSLYFGWQGYEVMSLHDFVRNHEFTIPEVTPNLKAFVNYVTKVLPVNQKSVPEKEKMIYHIVDQTTWTHSVKEGQYWPRNSREAFIHASDYNQITGTLKKHFSGKKDLLLLTVDPLKVKAEIKYEDLTGEDQLFPHIYGSLNTDAILRIEHL